MKKPFECMGAATMGNPLPDQLYLRFLLNRLGAFSCITKPMSAYIMWYLYFMSDPLLPSLDRTFLYTELVKYRGRWHGRLVLSDKTHICFERLTEINLQPVPHEALYNTCSGRMYMSVLHKSYMTRGQVRSTLKRILNKNNQAIRKITDDSGLTTYYLNLSKIQHTSLDVCIDYRRIYVMYKVDGYPIF